MKRKKRLKLLYDGSCLVCNREIQYYKRRDTHDELEPVDISSKKFDPSLYNLSEKEVNKYFHVVTHDGRILKGVEAFREIWKTLPGFEKWVKASDSKAIQSMMKMGYAGFVKIRPLLPKRRTCDV